MPKIASWKCYCCEGEVEEGGFNWGFCTVCHVYCTPEDYAAWGGKKENK